MTYLPYPSDVYALVGRLAEFINGRIGQLHSGQEEFSDIINSCLLLDCVLYNSQQDFIVYIIVCFYSE